MADNTTSVYQIYVGLNDGDTHEQIHDISMYTKILEHVCHSYHVAFSFNVVKGGYFHEDGTYVEENTLVLTVMGVAPDLISEIATDLCSFFNQESVMVTESASRVYFLTEGFRYAKERDKGRNI